MHNHHPASITVQQALLTHYSMHLPSRLYRPGLTDCGALGKIILGGPQIKVKTKKKKKALPF